MINIPPIRGNTNRFFIISNTDKGQQEVYKQPYSDPHMQTTQESYLWKFVKPPTSDIKIISRKKKAKIINVKQSQIIITFQR